MSFFAKWKLKIPTKWKGMRMLAKTLKRSVTFLVTTLIGVLCFSGGCTGGRFHHQYPCIPCNISHRVHKHEGTKPTQVTSQAPQSPSAPPALSGPSSFSTFSAPRPSIQEVEQKVKATCRKKFNNKDFQWCVFHLQNGTPGEWKKYAGENLTGKRVALIVHGHNTESLCNAFMNFVLGNRLGHWLGFKDRFDYGLNELVHLGRFFARDAHVPGQPGEKRFDLVLGFAYSSAYPLKVISEHFAKEAASFLGPCGSVVIFAHSMGGLMTRWALEKCGLGSKYRYLITLATPHQGVTLPFVQEIFSITPSEAISTIDMLTASPKLDEREISDFLKQLNLPSSPFSATAHYFTLVGNRFDDLTMDPPPLERPVVEPSIFNIGSIIQRIVSAHAAYHG
jgi:hypothetical protein